MPQLTSKDGTPIAYTRSGKGPPVVLVGGGLDDGAENAPLVDELADRFEVFNYARRGRGESGDTEPYALARELEDLAELIAVPGAPAHLFGASSGGALCLEAAAAGLPIQRMAVYEVPYPITEEEALAWREYRWNLSAAVSEGRRGDALELFMRLAGSTDEDIKAARSAPVWPDLERLAPTLTYDATCLGDGPPGPHLAGITQPTLILTGDFGLPGLDSGYFDRAASTLTTLIPKAERRTLPSQGHVAEPTALAPALADFFTRP